MTPVSFLKGLGVFVLLIALHYLVRPLLGTRISVDFLVIAVLLAAVHVRPGLAALIGFVVGIVADSLTPLTFGAGALAMSAVASAASWLKQVVFGDNALAQLTFLAAGKLAYDVVYVIAERRLGLGELVPQLFLWSPLSALATGLAGVIVVSMFRISMESRP
jgi:rod shape-determining protein MreD